MGSGEVSVDYTVPVVVFDFFMRGCRVDTKAIDEDIRTVPVSIYSIAKRL